jgi:hypothetical protein
MNKLIFAILLLASYHQTWALECIAEKKQVVQEVTLLESAGEKSMKSLLKSLAAKKGGVEITANFFELMTTQPKFVELQNARVSTATDFLRTVKTNDCPAALAAMKKMKAAVEEQWSYTNKILRALVKAQKS